jgi:hypothetical protein
VIRPERQRGLVQKARADVEQQLKACRRKLAHARERLSEAMKQQTATSGVMRILSSSPIQSVLHAVAENAARLCEANNAEIFRLENNLLRLVASYGEIPVNIQAREGIPANRERVIGRAACDRRTIQVRNLAAEESEFPAGSSDAKREGHRTTLATPLLREGGADRRHSHEAMGNPTVLRQADRASRELRRPGGDRDRERAPV